MAAIAAAAAGCGDTGSREAEELTVYVSVPLSGERAAEGEAVTNGARLALAEAGGKAAGIRIDAVYLDDTGGGESWTPVAAAENARRAAEDSAAIGFIGDLDSGATRVTLPITNQAGIAQVSPGAAAPELTRYESEELDPERFRPSDERSFVRLPPATGEAATCLSGDLLRRFEGRFGPVTPEAALGFEAMSLLLDSIERAEDEGDERDAVVDEMLATSGRESVLGTYSVDQNGDVTIDEPAACPQ